MSNTRKDLSLYGKKIYEAGLVAGAGGNISARDGRIIWMKPSGLALDEIGLNDWCGMEIRSGRQVAGKNRPTSEVNMHLGIYRVRPDINAVFHTHSPWLCGVMASGKTLKPMFAEFVVDLGRIGNVPYVTPTTQRLADVVLRTARKSDTLFLQNHGVIGLGVTMKEAFFRICVSEDAAKSLTVASIVGRPKFLTRKQVNELLSLDACRHRMKMMKK